MTGKRRIVKVANGRDRKNKTSTAKEKQKMQSSTYSSETMEANVDSEMHPDSGSLPPKKTPNFKSASVRRSNRLKNPILPSGVGNMAEPVNLDENENEEPPQVNVVEKNLREEEEAPQVQKVVNGKILEKEGPEVPEVSTIALGNLRKIEEQVDYLIRSVDEYKKTITRRENGGPSSDLSYKNLYISSQKKIEALIEENNQLVRELEFARGKVEAYESMKNAFGASKEVIVVSGVANTAEANATLSLSPNAPQKRIAPTAAADDDDDDRITSPKQKKSKKDAGKQKKKQYLKKKR